MREKTEGKARTGGFRPETKGRLSCREGWEAEQVNVAETVREQDDASSERQRAWRSLG